MKDVSEILAKRLKQLEGSFSREWLADFASLMKFIRTNPLTIEILEAIVKAKIIKNDAVYEAAIPHS